MDRWIDRCLGCEGPNIAELCSCAACEPCSANVARDTQYMFLCIRAGSDQPLRKRAEGRGGGQRGRIGASTTTLECRIQRVWA